MIEGSKCPGNCLVTTESDKVKFIFLLPQIQVGVAWSLVTQLAGCAVATMASWFVYSWQNGSTCKKKQQKKIVWLSACVFSIGWHGLLAAAALFLRSLSNFLKLSFNFLIAVITLILSKLSRSLRQLSTSVPLIPSHLPKPLYIHPSTIHPSIRSFLLPSKWCQGSW